MLPQTLQELIPFANNDAVPEEVAADYAIEACEEDGSQFFEDNIIAHLKCLQDYGAVFERYTALTIALSKAPEAQ